MADKITCQKCGKYELDLRVSGPSAKYPGRKYYSCWNGCRWFSFEDQLNPFVIQRSTNTTTTTVKRPRIPPPSATTLRDQLIDEEDEIQDDGDEEEEEEEEQIRKVAKTESDVLRDKIERERDDAVKQLEIILKEVDKIKKEYSTKLDQAVKQRTESIQTEAEKRIKDAERKVIEAEKNVASHITKVKDAQEDLAQMEKLVDMWSEQVNSQVENIPPEKRTEPTSCKICFTNPASEVFFPCKHLGCCKICCEMIRAKNPKKCPFCNQVFHYVMSVFVCN